MAKVNQGPLPPYVAYSTLKKLLKDLGQEVPSRFDSSYYERLKLSGSTRSALKNALVYLGLSDNAGYPSDTLIQLVKSEGEARKSMLRVITKQSYGSLFSELDMGRATPLQLKEHFKNLGTSKEIGRKCMSFFLALSDDSGMNLSSNLQQAVPGTRGKKTPGKSNTKKAEGMAIPFDQPNYMALLINKFPNLDPTWPQNTKDKWFDDFTLLVNRLCNNSNDQPPSMQD